MYSCKNPPSSKIIWCQLQQKPLLKAKEIKPIAYSGNIIV